MTPYLSKCTKEISVPREVEYLEKRVAITPSQVRKLIKIGFRVKVETKAGEAAGYNDEAYQRAGAKITDTKDLWHNSEIIIKIRAPTFNKNLGEHEADTLSNTKLFISYLYPGINPDLLKQVHKDKPNLTMFALDCTPRTTRAQKLDTLSSNLNLTGYR